MIGQSYIFFAVCFIHGQEVTVSHLETSLATTDFRLDNMTQFEKIISYPDHVLTGAYLA